MVFFLHYQNSIFIGKVQIFLLAASRHFTNFYLDKLNFFSYAKSCFPSLQMWKNHSSTSDSLEYTKSCIKKGHAPSFSKICTLHENGPKQRLRNLLEIFKPEFKQMTENIQDQLHQEECKQSKGVKIFASIRRELERGKCSKTFCEIFAR